MTKTRTCDILLSSYLVFILLTDAMCWNSPPFMELSDRKHFYFARVTIFCVSHHSLFNCSRLFYDFCSVPSDENYCPWSQLLTIPVLYMKLNCCVIFVFSASVRRTSMREKSQISWKEALEEARLRSSAASDDEEDDTDNNNHLADDGFRSTSGHTNGSVSKKLLKNRIDVYVKKLALIWFSHSFNFYRPRTPPPPPAR